MNWADETFIKVYVRDTAGWLELPWQARGLVIELARKVDAKGYLEIGRPGRRGIGVLLRAPFEEVEPWLDLLEKEQQIEWLDGDRVLFLPGHEARQSAVASSTQRSRAFRERNAAQRDATPCNAGDDQIRSDEIRSEQTPECGTAGSSAAEPDQSAPRARPLPRSEQALHGSLWASEYALGIAEATSEPFSFPLQDLGVLRKVIEDHCLDRSQIVPWVRATALAFAKAIPPDRATFWSGFSPRGLQKWLNMRRPDERSGPRRGPIRQAPNPGSPIFAAAQRALADQRQRAEAGHG